MKKVIVIISCLLLLASVGTAGLSCGSNEAKVEVTWKIGTYGLPGTFQANQVQSFADLVKEKSDGRMEVKVYAGDVYSASELFTAVQTGALDLAHAAVSYYFEKMPITASIISFSNVKGDGLRKNATLAKALVAGVPGMVKEAADAKLSHLWWIASGSSDLYTKTPVKTMADMKGMKLGCGPGVGPVVTAMGASPVEMDIGEIYLSAQTGLIDGWFLASTEDTYIKMRLYEVLPNITVIGLFTALSVIMNQASFDALPADLQKVVQDAASETEAKGITAYENSWKATLQSLKNNTDMKSVYVLPDAERATWFNTAMVPMMTGLMGYYAQANDIAKVNEIVARVLG